MGPPARVPFRLDAAGGRRLRGDLRLPDAGRARTVRSGEDAPAGAAIVICHGFKGFKDWGFFPAVAESLAVAVDCPVVSFNFTGSGVGADLGRFTDPEAFATNTFSREVGDLEAVLDGLAEGRLGAAHVARADRVALLGHSRGAVAATLVGSRRPAVRAVATWSALAFPDRYARLFTGKAEARGWAEVRNARTGEVLRLGRDVLDDLRAQAERLDPSAALAGSDVPLLAVHGEEDESVPVSDSRALVRAAGSAELLVLPGTGHTFDVRHPYMGATPALELALARTAQFFRARLFEEV